MNVKKKSNWIRNTVIGISIPILGAFLTFVAKTQYDIASSLREMRSDNETQWQLLQDISKEMRNHTVDVEVTRTIQKTVILPALFGETPARMSRQMQKLEKELDKPKRAAQDVEDIEQMVRQLEESKIYPNEAMEGDYKNFRDEQTKLRQTK